jgi:hypothetical protein
LLHQLRSNSSALAGSKCWVAVRTSWLLPRRISSSGGCRSNSTRICTSDEISGAARRPAAAARITAAAVSFSLSAVGQQPQSLSHLADPSSLRAYGLWHCRVLLAA